MAEGVALIDKNGLVVKANRAMEQITGLSLQQVEGAHYAVCGKGWQSPDNTAVDLEDMPVSRVLAGKKTVKNVEIGMERYDGTLVWLSANAIPILDNNGNLEGVVRTLSDITERKRMEDVIKQNEARLRLMLDQMPSMLWVTDTNLVFTLSLGAGLQAFNLKPNQLVGITLFTYYRTENPEFAPIQAHRQALQGEPASYELRWEGKILSCYVEPMRDKTDNIIGVIGTSFDITEKTLAGDALRALSRRLVDVQENERRNIARELHDEIGQSLTALKFMMTQGTRSIKTPVPPSLVEAQTTLTELIRQVREMSLKLRPSMLDDLGLLPTLIWYIERYIAQTQIKVDFEHDGLHREFSSELNTAIYRIVQEALTNVARHANTKEVSVRIWANDDNISLRIEDRGCGFTTSALSPSTSTGISGMKERVLSLAGKLNIETSPGRGTCLTAELPIKDSGK
jgi:PAS domain S-box-containing protein